MPQLELIEKHNDHAILLFNCDFCSSHSILYIDHMNVLSEELQKVEKSDEDGFLLFVKHEKVFKLAIACACCGCIRTVNAGQA